jgi:hypothetical protein
MSNVPRPRRAWWLVDGLPHWLLKDAVRRAPERLPTFAQVLAQSQLARLTPLGPNCQTPPSMAALYSGRDSGGTGLCGFDQPDFTGGRRVAVEKAFRRGPDRVPFVWERDREDRGVRFLHVPFVSDQMWAIASYATFGFSVPVVQPGCLPLPEAQALFGEAANGLSCTHWSDVPATLPSGLRPRIRARLHELEGQTAVMVLGHWDVRHRGRSLAIDAPFMGPGLEHVYRQGRLGPTLIQGGAGRAEKAFVDSLRQMAAHYSALWLRHFGHPDHDDIYGYQPALDLALHELVGFVAPDCRHASPTREQVVWPLLLDLLGDLDGVFGATLAMMRPEDRILLTSDHGMMPVDTLVRPNLILEEMGMLKRTPNAEIDAGRSLAWLHPAENGVLCIDASGCAARQKSPEAIISGLCAELSRRTGRQASVTVYPDIERSLSPPAGVMARHFLSTGRYTQFRADLSGEIVSSTRKTGEHLATCADPSLDGVVIDATRSHRFAPSQRLKTTEVAAYLCGPTGGY